MRPPSMSSVIERRLLVNYRVDPEVAAKLLAPLQLPAPLRPQLVNGWAVAGICLIRLGRLRPSRLPGWAGMRTENAAHRIAVEWDSTGGRGAPSGAEDWCDLHERMNFIVNLFRSRQRRSDLFDPPFDDEQVAALGRGEKPGPPY